MLNEPGSMRITINLPPLEASILARLAQAEFRDLRAQAFVVLRQALLASQPEKRPAPAEQGSSTEVSNGQED